MTRVAAPGKLLLSGAYAVLDGATALVMAVNRYAVADTTQWAPASREVQAALGTAEGPRVTARGMYDGEAKLGLGSSAAVLVASLGACSAAANGELTSGPARFELLRAARRAHAEAQGGGSGVDVAASVFGGVLAYSLTSETTSLTSETTSVRPLPPLPGLYVDAVWSGFSSRTSELRAALSAWQRRDRTAHAARLAGLAEASASAVHAVEAGDAVGLLDALRHTGLALAALGRDAKASIVPPVFAQAAKCAAGEHAVLYPSGAGGGDVAVFAGWAPPSPALLAAWAELGMRPLSLACDRGGVRLWAADPDSD